MELLMSDCLGERFEWMRLVLEHQAIGADSANEPFEIAINRAQVIGDVLAHSGSLLTSRAVIG
jgi:hypothetical protein